MMICEARGPHTRWKRAELTTWGKVIRVTRWVKMHTLFNDRRFQISKQGGYSGFLT